MDEARPLSLAAEPETLPAPRAVPGGKRAAWLFLALGYLFCCVFPMSEKPLAAALFLVLLYALSFSLLLRGRVRFGAVQKLVLLSAALALAAALLWSNGGNAFLCFLYALTAYAYLLYAASGNCLEEGLSALVGADLVRALVVYPFSSFGRIFPSLALQDEKGAGKLLLKVLLGLMLAVLPTAAVLSLLSFDSGFRAIVEKIFSFRQEDVRIQIARVLFTLPVAMYLFGLYASSLLKAGTRDAAAQGARERAERRRVVPLVTACAAVIPLLLIYIIFFFSQWGYYTAAFSGALPAGLSYAEYAREGFFQLCAVAAINFLVVICLCRYVRRERAALLRVLCLLLSLFTLVLIGTAMSKLSLYVAEYGLTPDRVYAAWFMCLLALLFVLVAVGQFVPSFKTLPLCLAVTVALYLLLAVSGPGRWIARYNVDRYLSGETQEIDVYLLSSLGDDAVPEMLRLDEYWSQGGEAPNRYVREDLQDCLRERAETKSRFWRQTLSSLRAERMLTEAGYLPPDR